MLQDENIIIFNVVSASFVFLNLPLNSCFYWTLPFYFSPCLQQQCLMFRGINQLQQLQSQNQKILESISDVSFSPQNLSCIFCRKALKIQQCKIPWSRETQESALYPVDQIWVSSARFRFQGMLTYTVSQEMLLNFCWT